MLEEGRHENVEVKGKAVNSYEALSSTSQTTKPNAIHTTQQPEDTKTRTEETTIKKDANGTFKSRVKR